jgi:pimeloyl-ACP methyl ester carboxylesterase
MESFQSHDGTRIAYLDQGEGPAVLLMHGLTANVTVNWIVPGIVDALVGGGFRVLAIDTRGHDNSEAPVDPAAYHPDAIAGDAVQLVRKLSAEPIAAVGYSYGCRTAAILATDKKIALSAVVLAGLDLETTLLPHPRGNPVTEAVCAALEADDPESVTVPGIKEMRAQITAWNAEHKAMAHIFRGMQDARTLDLGTIEAPTLVMNSPGEPDPALVADLIPGARTARLAQGNHMTGPTEPDFLPHLLGFLGEHLRPGS